MAREWMDEGRGRDMRRDRYEDRRSPVDPADRDDFGQADFSTDYGYDPDSRSAHRLADEHSRRSDDYGQADYSSDYAYDPDRGRGYRRFSDDDRDYGRMLDADRDYDRRMDADDYRRGEPSRSWRDRAGAFLGGRDSRLRHRRGPSDRVLWTVIVERLEADRGLDLRDVEVFVEDAEVTLNGTVRRKHDKRRIEDIADIDGVRHVQNNLRVRDGLRRWF
jgi:hypothetical protein